ncbi:hypothetical protein Pmani_005645 [Petrolisthes manimaculis]|uniref:Dynein assembly factor 3, axonemal n=1 Tax=Petrolisthes manimaculis TaxID=1843537 RepID=A0AAE1UMP8_9EUCA|nr:hypothetical protein Pmani_005645 [Petrolisthes manimaculis]
MLGHGLINWWGFSPPVDLLSYNNEPGLEKGMVQVAVVGAGDPRHLLLTLARGGARGKHLRMYVIEAQVEVYARLLLLVGTALQLGLGLRERVSLLLDLWANLYLRPTSRTYLELTARRLAMSVTDPGQYCKLVGLVNAARLKYRERDALDAVFRSWYTLTPAKYDPSLAWDTRQRQLLGTRYDNKQAEADWAWHMRLTFRIQKLHLAIHKPDASKGDRDDEETLQEDGYVGVSDAWGREFLTWRGSGRAFTIATDNTATLANTSLASVVVVAEGGTRHRRVGYWGDLLSGPFPALALASHLSLVNKTQNGRATVSGSELALRQLEYILHQLLSEYMEGEEVQGGQSIKHVLDKTKRCVIVKDVGNSEHQQGEGNNLGVERVQELQTSQVENKYNKKDEEGRRGKEEEMVKHVVKEENRKEGETEDGGGEERSKKEEDKGKEEARSHVEEGKKQERIERSKEEEGRNKEEKSKQYGVDRSKEEEERSRGEEEKSKEEGGRSKEEENKQDDVDRSKEEVERSRGEEEKSKEEKETSKEEEGKNQEEENKQQEEKRSKGGEEERSLDEEKDQQDEVIQGKEERSQKNEDSDGNKTREETSHRNENFNQERQETNKAPVAKSHLMRKKGFVVQRRSKDIHGKPMGKEPPPTPKQENLMCQTEGMSTTRKTFKCNATADLEGLNYWEVAGNSKINPHGTQPHAVNDSQQGHERINTGRAKDGGISEDEVKILGFQRSHSLDQTTSVREKVDKGPARRCRSTGEYPTAMPRRKKSSVEGGRPYFDYLQLEGVEVILLSPSRLSDLSSLHEVYTRL